MKAARPVRRGVDGKVLRLRRVTRRRPTRHTPNGTAVTKIRLATDRNRSNGDTETDWHSVVCWDKLAEAVNNYVGKGQRIYVEGRLVQSSWETDDGQRRHRTEISASEVVFLDCGNGNGHGGQAPEASPFR